MALANNKRLLLLGLWLIVLTISLRQHTPWRDEYQSWLISSRTETPAEFFDAIKYERHPPLLYILQKSILALIPSSANWNPQLAIDTVTIPFTIATALLILFFLNLPTALSAFLIFGPLLLREYGVISRCYIIGIFFLLLATAFAKRKRLSAAFISLAIGAFSHLLLTWVCGAIFVLLAWSERKQLPKAAFLASGSAIVLAILLQIPPPDSIFATSPTLDLKQIFLSLKAFNQMLWGIEKFWLPYKWNTQPMTTDITLILLLPALYFLRKEVRLAYVFWVCFPPVFLLASTYSISTRYLGVSFFGLVSCWSLFPRAHVKAPRTLLLFTFTAFVSSMGWWWQWAPYKPRPNFYFSGARELNSSGIVNGSESVLVAENEALFFTWMAESHSTIFHALRDRPLKYPHFKKDEYIFDSLEEWCSVRLFEFSALNSGRNMFFGMAKGTPLPKNCGDAKLVFRTSVSTLTDESFDIYRLTSGP